MNTNFKGSLFKKPDNFRIVPNFYFKVQMVDKSFAMEEGFTEVSGLVMTIETETVTGGGMQNKQYKVPKGITFDDLVLKRPLMIPKSGIAKWCETTIQGGMVGIKPKDLIVTLMHPITGLTSAAWKVYKAYPVKYEVLGFNSTDNNLAHEQIQLAYQSFEHVPDLGSFAVNTVATLIR